MYDNPQTMRLETNFYFFKRLLWVGNVLFMTQLDPFLSLQYKRGSESKQA
jgi:hypothetical protein